MIDMCLEYLDEQAPPLPVPEFEVRGTVPLHDSESSELLLLLQKGSEKKNNKKIKINKILHIIQFL